MRLTAFGSTIILAGKRLWRQRLLMLCLLAGLVTAVGVLSGIPLYADAVHHRLLHGELTEAGTYRPPFAFLWRYVGAWHGEITWAEVAPVDEYLSQQAAGVIGLPLDSLVRHVKTGNLRLFPAEGGAFAGREPLLWTALGFIDGLEEHISLIEGAFPGATAGEDVPVLVSQALAERMGFQVGERYILLGTEQAQIPVQVVGVWRPLDPADPFWFYPPRSFDELLLTAEPIFVERVTPALDRPVSQAVWYQIFDGGRVRAADVPGLLDRIAAVEARATALLAHTTLDASPVEALEAYRRAARLLTLRLSLFGVPIVGLLGYFIALIAALVVRRDQGEIAVLRSRGAGRGQVLLIYLLEGLLVGGLGLAGGLALGRWLAALMSRTRTFLDFRFLGEIGNLAVSLSPTALGYGLLGLGLALLAFLIPAFSASRHTIVTFKWERARTLRRPLWQRAFLDLLLLAPLLYGWYLLRQQGTITPFPQPTNFPIPNPQFANPLLFLVPALFGLALSLLFLRLLPLLMEALAWLAGWWPGVTPLLILRQIARSAAQYTGPLLLLSLTLSLAAFSASLAVTLDAHLTDRVYYQVGADLRLAELGESTEEPPSPGFPGQSAAPSSPEGEGARWLFLPVSEHLRVPGVRAAARVGDYTATANLGGRQQTGRLLGVDRLDFAAVAFYRPDFAGGESLGGLMNRLAVDRSNLLVSRDFLRRHGLSVGDPLRLTVGAAGEFREIEFTVAAPLDLFPTLYPQDGPFFVANLDYVFEGLGGLFPYDVWLATDPDAPGKEIVTGVRALGVAVVSASDACAQIAQEQARPERQGLFGLLTVGFLAAALLTVLGFLVYAVVSFRRRYIELGLLRAVGLSAGQMAAYLAGEQALLLLLGAGLGTALGLAASRLFIPYLQVGADKTAQVPPFVVRIAWQELGLVYAVFGGMFLAAVGVLVVLLLRIKIFEAVKLGETG